MQVFILVYIYCVAIIIDCIYHTRNSERECEVVHAWNNNYYAEVFVALRPIEFGSPLARFVFDPGNMTAGDVIKCDYFYNIDKIRSAHGDLNQMGHVFRWYILASIIATGYLFITALLHYVAHYHQPHSTFHHKAFAFIIKLELLVFAVGWLLTLLWDLEFDSFIIYAEPRMNGGYAVAVVSLDLGYGWFASPSGDWTVGSYGRALGDPSAGVITEWEGMRTETNENPYLITDRGWLLMLGVVLACQMFSMKDNGALPLPAYDAV
jgi:hypothetical protein